MHDDRLTCHISDITCLELNPNERQAGPLVDMQHDKVATKRLLYPCN